MGHLTLSAAEVEFLAQEETVEIIPNFSAGLFRFVSVSSAVFCGVFCVTLGVLGRYRALSTAASHRSTFMVSCYVEETS